MSVAGNTAIVTGAGTGIGRATAQLLGARGGGAVVNVSSVTFFTGYALLPAYAPGQTLLVDGGWMYS
jgi:hypothetical protein